jgi:hypothetical protein
MAVSSRSPPRVARPGLSAGECTILKRLSTPERIQAFVDAIPANHEADGETVLSVREVLRQRRAHCIEGAFVAACALWVIGRPPLVMHLDCDPADWPHVIALFRRGRAWGAISKSNHIGLRYRDPVYRSLRELAMSYFHEYCDRRGHRTLVSHSAAFDLRRIDPALWVTSDTPCWQAHDRLANRRHYPLVTARQRADLSRLDPFERKLAQVAQFPRPSKRGE